MKQSPKSNYDVSHKHIKSPFEMFSVPSYTKMRKYVFFLEFWNHYTEIYTFAIFCMA
jgi:hypothetical protein